MEATREAPVAQEAWDLFDKIIRLETFYRIQVKETDTSLQLMILKPAQREFLQNRGLRNFILKSRRIGFSTCCLIDLLDDAITTPNINCAILAQNKESVIKLFEIVKRAYDNLPGGYKPPASLDNRNELAFLHNGSKIYVTLDTRSQTVHKLHISELAFIEDPDRIKASLESVPADGQITFETTANGMAGYAYEEWTDEDSRFQKFFFPWYGDGECQIQGGRSMEEVTIEYAPLAQRYGLIPDIAKRFKLTAAQMEFYITKIKDQKEKVVQEYPTTPQEAFMASGRGIFHAADLAKHPPQQPVKVSGGVTYWEEPLPGFFYVMGVDPAEGTGNDNSAVQILNANTGKQAAEYANNRVQADELATITIKLARDFNMALIVPEINSPAYISHLRRKYDNIYRREVFDKTTQKKTKSLGWRTTAMSKKKLVEELEEAERNLDIEICSGATIKEMTTFVRTDEKGKQGYGGEGTNHDDRVIALGLAVQGMSEQPHMKKQETGEEIAKRKLREWIDQKGLEKTFPGQPDGPIAKHRKRYSLRGITRG